MTHQVIREKFAATIRDAFFELATMGWRARDIGMSETKMLEMLAPTNEPLVQSILRRLNLDGSRTHVAELEAAIDRVCRLHAQDDSLLAPGRWCPACGNETPCPTIRALREPR